MDDYFATAPATAPTAYPSTGWSPLPPPPPAKRGGLRLAHLKVVGTVVLTLWAARWAYYEAEFWAKDHSPLHSPAQIGSAPRLGTREAKQLEQEIGQEMSWYQNPQVAIYGSGGAEFLLIAALAQERSAAEVLRPFMDEGRKSGSTFGKPVKRANGMSCVTVSDAQSDGAACAWVGKRSNGLVWAFVNPDISEVAELTATARTAVNK